MTATTRNYPFGGRVSRVITPAFAIMVSTAKEGWFQKQSTMIFLLIPPNYLDRGPAIGKFTWVPDADSQYRLRLHDQVVASFDKYGTQDTGLVDVIEIVVNAMRISGNAAAFQAFPLR